jgi:hypothetical protein
MRTTGEKVHLKIPINSGLRQAGFVRPRKVALGFWFHQILFFGLLLVERRDLANLVKSSSGIWPFSITVSQLWDLPILSKSSSSIRPTFKFTFGE